jgi:hypothetical protein
LYASDIRNISFFNTNSMKPKKTSRNTFISSNNILTPRLSLSAVWLGTEINRELCSGKRVSGGTLVMTREPVAFRLYMGKKYTYTINKYIYTIQSSVKSNVIQTRGFIYFNPADIGFITYVHSPYAHMGYIIQ